MGSQGSLVFTRYSFTSRLLCDESNILMFPPPTCIGQTVELLLHDYWAVYGPLPTSLLYATHHTILVITISCKGQRAALDALMSATLL